MRVSEYYKLNKKQPSLSFLDVDIENDVKLFVNARALRILESDWGEHCTHLLHTFFSAVVDSIRSGNDTHALDILTVLKEPNETHLGLSKGRSDGRGLGPEKAKQIWNAFKKSKAVKSGLLSDLEDTVLLIDGVSTDILSDIITNIIRGPLIAFTQRVCEEYGIPLINDVDSGPVWNPNTKSWDQDYVRLPMPDDTKLILVPKSIVRIDMDYSVEKYYRHYVLERFKEEEMERNTGLVQILKSGKNKGKKIVYKKDVEAKYGSEAKALSIKKTDENPDLLMKYKADNSGPTPALSHRQIADVQGTELPDWARLLESVTSLQPGKKDAYKYEDAIGDLLSALFYPVLVDPETQTSIHDGMKRVDITFTNYARTGFFEWLARHYDCSHVFVECKNFGNELGNPEIDQIAMRFSKDRGRFGIVVCRTIENRVAMQKRCKAVATDGHGYIVAIDDKDLESLIADAEDRLLQRYDFPTVKRLFDKLIF
ncbi:hypothetical protein QFZ34_002194 [Phyllobacterium ifriqiyense]|uniref:Restriction endonuclease type IV Mrr domain-containing protein n=1 Tax=Phyllobacterium ifriqiyense TaxID=314238 RepID=A0ABU0S8D2_9HYPH|nr:hypothetical protein [Phyllobacterium ifriqiyense]MDQ0997012.1 hypothetical protein [Phyllobacterium ifriqiyense]